MKKAPIPANEEERLKDLFTYNVLDSAPEQSFDDITDLASHICQTPIALISLIDNDRQWFKSNHGLDAAESDRDVSFCGHAIHQNDIFEIKNASTDTRFSDNPLVTDEPKIVFYAGYPLTSTKGYNLGTLCVIDHKPRELTESQKKALRILGRQVIGQLELRRSNANLIKVSKRIQEQSEKIEKQQEAFIEQAKMASLGLMAGGIAHEINNPMSVIHLANMQIKLLPESKKSEKITDATSKIDRTVERIVKIIKSLRTISRDASHNPMSEAFLDKIVEDTLSICREKFKSRGVSVEKSGDFSTEILCREGEISQILLNLLANAFDAVENVPEPWIRIQAEQRDDEVVVSVIDSGEGIKDSSKLMDPFYTTKPVGKGIGLGLSISKTIAKSHKGRLELDKSSPYTKFDLALKVPPLKDEKQKKSV